MKDLKSILPDQLIAMFTINKDIIKLEDDNSPIAQIFKMDDEKQIVYGVVIEPMTEVTPEGDTHGHRMKEDEVEKTAHTWLERYRAIDLSHDFKKSKAIPVESYIAPSDITIGEEVIKKGSWVLALHIIEKKIWEDIKGGKYNGFSPGGIGKLKDIK